MVFLASFAKPLVSTQLSSVPVGPGDLVWSEGMAQWMPASQVPDLMPASATAEPPPASMRPAMPFQAATTYLKPHRGPAVLVLGILGFPVCFILGIVAWSMGNSDLREMDSGLMDPSGRGLTNAGRICGKVSTILALCMITFYAVIFIVMAATGGLHHS